MAGIEVIPDLGKQPKCKAFSGVITKDSSYKNHTKKTEEFYAKIT